MHVLQCAACAYNFFQNEMILPESFETGVFTCLLTGQRNQRQKN